jgi:hypothetical protein
MSPQKPITLENLIRGDPRAGWKSKASSDKGKGADQVAQDRRLEQNRHRGQPARGSGSITSQTVSPRAIVQIKWDTYHQDGVSLEFRLQT